MAAPSVYSFDTSLDAERFIDDFNGRYGRYFFFIAYHAQASLFVPYHT